MRSFWKSVMGQNSERAKPEADFASDSMELPSSGDARQALPQKRYGDLGLWSSNVLLLLEFLAFVPQGILTPLNSTGFIFAYPAVHLFFSRLPCCALIFFALPAAPLF